MSVVTGATAVQALLGSVLAAGPPKDLPQEVAPSGLSPATLITLLLGEVDDLVSYAIKELRPVRRKLFAWDNPPDDGPTLSAAALDRRDQALELTWVTVMRVGPLLRSIHAASRPELYLTLPRKRLLDELGAARESLGTAVAEALRGAPRDRVDDLVDTGITKLNRFPRLVTDLYLKENGGLEVEITVLGDRVADLIALRNEQGADALPAGRADSEAGVSQTVAGGPWFHRKTLMARLAAARDLRDSVLADGATRPLTADMHSIALMISLLETRERLTWYADQALVVGPLDTRLRGYVTALGPALDDLADAAMLRRGNDPAGAAAKVSSALAAAATVTGSEQFTDDVETAQSLVRAEQWIVLVAKGVAIGLAVAIVTGGAGWLADVAVAEAVVAAGAEISIVEVAALRIAAGTFVAFVETVTSRGLSELLFGPGSLTTPFLTDLALGLGFRAASAAVAWAASDVFLAAGRYHPAAGWALRVGVGRIEVQVFAEARTWISEGRLRTWDQRWRSLAEDLIITGIVQGANLLLPKFADRTAAARGAMTVKERDALDALDAERAQVVSDFDPIRNGTATAAEFLTWAKRAAGVWNRACEQVEKMKPGLGRDAALAELASAKAAAELRLAEVGIRADLSLPGAQPAFRALLPGLVEVTDEARPVLDAKYPPAARLPSGMPEVDLIRLPGGHPLLLLPAGTVPANPPPNSPPHSPETINDPDPELQELSETAARGLTRLRAEFGPAKIQDLLRGTQPADREAFLALLGNPGFEGVGLQNRIKWLRRAVASPEAVEFGRRFGPLPMFRLLKLGDGADFTESLDAATAKLAALPAGPQREALAQRIADTGDSRPLKVLLGRPVRVIAPRRPVTDRNLGIDRDNPTWDMHHAEVLIDKPNLTPEQQNVVTDLRQTKDAAKRGLFDDVRSDRKLAMLVEIDVRQDEVGLNTPETTGPANARRGTIAEYAFLHRLTRLGFELQVPMQKGVPQRLWVLGRSVFDAFRIAPDGTQEAVEGKSHILAVRSDQVRDATTFRAEGIADRDNMKPDARYYLWMFRDPGADGRQVMLDILMAPGTPFTEVFLGPDTPAPFQ